MSDNFERPPIAFEQDDHNLPPAPQSPAPYEVLDTCRNPDCGSKDVSWERVAPSARTHFWRGECEDCGEVHRAEHMKPSTVRRAA